ncbi:MAG: membrane-spanning protein [Christensenellaceae bacterium]|nr:membrane-spanning protein [Christensenellaceae bacterium]
MLLTILSALIIGLVFYKLKVPGGLMIGAVIGACAYNVFSGDAYMPPEAKFVAQIAAGAFVGVGVNREDLKQMKSIFKIALFVISSYFVLNVISGLIISRVGGIDPLTGMLCSAPGGLSDIPLIAEDMGADSSKVLVLQFARYLLGLGVFPTLINLLPEENAKVAVDKPTNVAKRNSKNADVPNTVLSLLVATASGFLGKYSGMPGGTMAFATVGTLIFKILYPKACINIIVRRVAQLLSGAYVGAKIGMAQLIDLKTLALPAVMLIVCYSLAAFIMGTFLYKRGVFTRREAYLAATPAGASDMALISEDLGISNIKIIILQVMRMVVVISIFPVLLNAIAKLVS